MGKRAKNAVRPRTEGQRRLLAVADSHAEVARRVGTTRQAVHAWRAGINARPTPEQRARLEAVYGVPADTWERAGEVGGGAATAAGNERLSKIAECDRLVALLREAQKGAAKRELAQLVAEESKQLERRDRIEREQREAELEQQLLEDRIVRTHPVFLRALEAIRGALRRHPAAMRDAIAALEALDREPP